MFEQIKIWTIEQVLWAEKNLKGKSGAEKKAAVVKKLDDMITLPSYLEWIDDILLSWFVDKVCDKLNSITEHNFGDLTLSENRERELAEEIADPEQTKEVS